MKEEEEEEFIEFVLAFLNAIYDEYILRPWSHESATIDGKTARALQSVVGVRRFSILMRTLERDKRVRVVMDLKLVKPSEAAIEILDYVK